MSEENEELETEEPEELKEEEGTTLPVSFNRTRNSLQNYQIFQSAYPQKF